MDLQAFYHMGIYYGYPDCCIAAFLEAPLITMRTDVQRDEKVHNLNGFIPCHKHAVQIQQGKIKIKDLISNRVCKKPYPDGGSTKDLDKYLNSIP